MNVSAALIGGKVRSATNGLWSEFVMKGLVKLLNS